MANAHINIMIPEQDLVNPVPIANPLLSYDFPGVDRPLNAGRPIRGVGIPLTESVFE